MSKQITRSVMKKYIFILSFALLSLGLSDNLFSYGLLQGRSRDRQDQQEREFMQDIYLTYSPFYSGPLLAPSANTVPKGKVNVQPYLFWQKTYGAYDRKWKQQHVASSVTLQPLCIWQYGLTDFMDLNATFQAWYKRSGTQQDFNYGDTKFSVGFQLLKDFLFSPFPACVFEVGVLFPSGRYQKLSPKKNGTDSTGSGSYITTFSLNFQKGFKSLFKHDLNPLSYHPFVFRWSAGYGLASKTKVKGINTYGGAHTTKGTVNPGNTFTTIFAWEYSLTESWVFATDWQYTVSTKTSFTGRDGGAKVGGDANQNWSVAPAIEYNISESMGALVGVWFSFAGRNSSQFVNGIISWTCLF